MPGSQGASSRKPVGVGQPRPMTAQDWESAFRNPLVENLVDDRAVRPRLPQSSGERAAGNPLERAHQGPFEAETVPLVWEDRPWGGGDLNFGLAGCGEESSNLGCGESRRAAWFGEPGLWAEPLPIGVGRGRSGGGGDHAGAVWREAEPYRTCGVEVKRLRRKGAREEERRCRISSPSISCPSCCVSPRKSIKYPG